MRDYPREGSVPHECIFDAKAEWIPFGEIGIFPPPLLTGILKKSPEHLPATTSPLTMNGLPPTAWGGTYANTIPNFTSQPTGWAHSSSNSGSGHP